MKSNLSNWFGWISSGIFLKKIKKYLKQCSLGLALQIHKPDMNHLDLNFKIQKTQIFDVLTPSMIDFICIHRYHLLNQESTRSVGIIITQLYWLKWWSQIAFLTDWIKNFWPKNHGNQEENLNVWGPLILLQVHQLSLSSSDSKLQDSTFVLQLHTAKQQ